MSDMAAHLGSSFDLISPHSLTLTLSDSQASKDAKRRCSGLKRNSRGGRNERRSERRGTRSAEETKNQHQLPHHLQSLHHRRSDIVHTRLLPIVRRFERSESHHRAHPHSVSSMM